MTHDHSHHSTEGVSDTRLLWSFVINQLLTVAQVVAGFLSGSVALLSDAAHNFNDANALLIAYIARRVSRKDADHRYTFGYRRAELIGALINLTTLGVIGLSLVYQAVMRFFEPVEIIGWLMAAAAGLAIVVDLGTALLLWSMSRGSLNVRAAFVHNLVDALGSVAVLLAAGLIIWLDWNWIDPVLTLVIAGYVLWQAFKMMPQAVRILMEGTPPDLDLDQLAEQVERIPGVEAIHHLHVWQLDEEHRALEAHVVTPDGADAQWTQTKQQIKDLLQEEFDIHHSTLEHEPQTPIDEDCENAGLITPH